MFLPPHLDLEVVGSPPRIPVYFAASGRSSLPSRVRGLLAAQHALSLLYFLNGGGVGVWVEVGVSFRFFFRRAKWSPEKQSQVFCCSSCSFTLLYLFAMLLSTAVIKKGKDRRRRKKRPQTRDRPFLRHRCAFAAHTPDRPDPEQPTLSLASRHEKGGNR